MCWGAWWQKQKPQARQPGGEQGGYTVCAAQWGTLLKNPHNFQGGDSGGLNQAWALVAAQAAHLRSQPGQGQLGLTELGRRLKVQESQGCCPAPGLKAAASRN